MKATEPIPAPAITPRESLELGFVGDALLTLDVIARRGGLWTITKGIPWCLLTGSPTNLFSGGQAYLLPTSEWKWKIKYMKHLGMYRSKFVKRHKLFC